MLKIETKWNFLNGLNRNTSKTSKLLTNQNNRKPVLSSIFVPIPKFLHNDTWYVVYFNRIRIYSSVYFLYERRVFRWVEANPKKTCRSMGYTFTDVHFQKSKYWPFKVLSKLLWTEFALILINCLTIDAYDYGYCKYAIKKQARY